MTVVALRYFGANGKVAFGHGNVEGDKMTVGVFATEEDFGNVAAGQATVLHDKTVNASEDNDTCKHGWA